LRKVELERVECIVVGAGVVGLAVAREMAIAGIETVVLEKESLIGSETSSRNSEVIHAGLYYPTDSLKARLCVDGKKRLYEYAQERGVGILRCGKLVVATQQQEHSRLEQLRLKAHANGVPEVEIWSAERAMELEPNLYCTAALWSATTGVVDSHGLMLAFQGDLEDHGGFVALESPLVSAEISDDGFIVRVGGDEPMQLSCRYLINAAGLHAIGLSDRIMGYGRPKGLEAYYCKGNYYGLPGKSPFNRLIYPMPQSGGLGVHVTVDLAGQCRFGPDTEWIEPVGADDIDYDVDLVRADVFYHAVRQYYPAIEDGSLVPGYAGCRPKIVGPGEPAGDFVIEAQGDHGIEGLVNLFGIESPGLTASLAIAAETRRRMRLGN
jgi:L-2-hydroxyglutarate oxidase LhgO